MLLTPVLSGLALGILPGSRGLWVGQVFALAGSGRLPRRGVESGLFQFGGEGRKLLAQVPGQAGVGSSDGHDHVAAPFGNAHFHALVTLSGYL